MAVDHRTTKNWTPCEFSIIKTETDFEAKTDYSCTSNTHEEHHGTDETINSPSSTEGLLSGNIPSRVNERAHINIIEMFEQAACEYCAFFIYEDLFSKYVVLRPLKKEPGSTNFVTEIAKNLIGIFSLVGAPRILESSNGRSFAEKLVQELRNRIPSLEMIHGNNSRKNYSRKDWKTLIQSWQMANPSRIWHEGLHVIQIHENTCTSSSSQGETSRNSPAEVFFKANLTNDLVLSVSNTNSIETVKSRMTSPSSPNEFIDSDDEKENVNNSNLINSMKNEIISVTENDSVGSIDEAGYESFTEEEWPIKIESCKSPIPPPASSNELIDSNDIEQNVDSSNLINSVNDVGSIDEAGYESFTEEEWPIKIEPCKSPIPPPASSNELIDSNDIEQNVVSSNLINSVNDVLCGTEKDSVDTKKRGVSKNGIYRCYICNKIFGRMCNLKNHMRSHKENDSSVENEINLSRRSSRISLSSNKKTIIGEKNYPSTYTLRRHTSPAHQRKKIYKCEICAKTFNAPSGLTRHKLVHIDRQPSQCNLSKKLLLHIGSIHKKSKLFKCDSCERTFASKQNLQCHIASAHKNIKPFKCHFCNKTYASKVSARRHIVAIHEDIKQFKCNICKAIFTANQGLQHHIVSVHKKIKPFKCDICYKTFASNKNLQCHIGSVHKNIKPFECDICKKTFARKQSLRYHIVSVHGNIRPFKCDICKNTYASKLSARRHIVASHGDIKQFECNTCKASFTAKHSLQYHTTFVHKKIKSFKCDICEKTFATKQTVQRHMASGHKHIGSLKCDICKITFVNQKYLQRHITIVHEDIRPFKCDICKKAFVSKHYLSHHVTSVHKKIKPFKCDICKKIFATKQNVQRHIVSGHKKINPFKCDICEITFASKQTLRYHIVSDHGNITPFKCDICNKMFTRKRSLQHHIASVHNGIRRVKCDICNITFTNKYGLRRHVLRIHIT